MLETMIWPDEVRTADFAFLDEDIELRSQEQNMARSLVESMAGDFEPEQYTDDYRAALEAVIDAKVEGREVVAADDEQPTAGNVVDLMSALRASVDAAKKGRGESAAGTNGGGAADGKSTAKKAAAKKPPAKKAAAKKTTGAKKAPVKKPAAKKSTKTAGSSAKQATAGKATAKKAARKTA